MNQLHPDKHPRVDIVVSDTAVRESTRILLEVHEFTCSDFAAGKDYILAEPHQVDCLLTDRVLSDMTGLEFLEHLRTCGNRTPAVMMTGRVDEEMIAQANRLFLRLLEKPPLTDSLLASIHDAQLAGHSPETPQGGTVAPRFPASVEAAEPRHPSWIDKAGTGVAIFDSEHRQLNELVIDFYDAILAGEPKATLDEHFQALSGHAADHFAHEENYMRFAGYPDADRHSNAHKCLMEALAGVPLNNVRDDENGSIRALEVLRFLKHWLIDHIQSEDRRLGAFLNGQGIR